MEEEARPVTYSVEHSARIYHNGYGYSVEVREDADSLELCELVYRDDPDSSETRFVIGPWPMAEKVAEAIIRISKLNSSEVSND